MVIWNLEATAYVFKEGWFRNSLFHIPSINKKRACFHLFYNVHLYFSFWFKSNKLKEKEKFLTEEFLEKSLRKFWYLLKKITDLALLFFTFVWCFFRRDLIGILICSDVFTLSGESCAISLYLVICSVIWVIVCLCPDIFGR